jgi:hypothetical protein
LKVVDRFECNALSEDRGLEWESCDSAALIREDRDTR